MASIKEIRTHIKSVEQTLKITNAMYLISSSNLRKARKQLTDAEPYFGKIKTTIGDIFQNSDNITHQYLDKRKHIPADQRKVGFIVITGDKGMAGAYNHNILKLVEEKLAVTPNYSLFVVGQVGRAYFAQRNIEIEESFNYVTQNPTIKRARDISSKLINMYLEGQLDEIHVVFTYMVNSFVLEPTIFKVLPLDPDTFPPSKQADDGYTHDVVYLPSVEAAISGLVPGYFKGIIFSMLVESFCAEQNARMTAMKSSSDNARDMLQHLNLSFNRARQSAITQEITEVVGGAQASL